MNLGIENPEKERKRIRGSYLEMRQKWHYLSLALAEVAAKA